jgi:hypothetical protein
MMISHNTHVALSRAREQDLRRAVEHSHTVAAGTRQVTEEAPAVSRLRRRLAQMRLAPSPAG